MSIVQQSIIMYFVDQVVVANMLETRRSEVTLVSLQGSGKELATKKLKMKEEISGNEKFTELEKMIVDEICQQHRTFIATASV